MMTEIFSVYDAAAARYIDPFPAPTVDFAIRAFREGCADPEHMFCKFPEDYALYHIGSFDTERGVIKNIEGVKIAMASNFRDLSVEGISDA